MNLGIYLGGCLPQSGGAYSYESNILNALNKNNTNHKVFIFYHGVYSILKNNILQYVKVKKMNKFFLLLNKIVLNIFNVELNRSIDKDILKNRVQLMIFITPNNFEPVSVPFVFVLWDLAHRRYPFFPEVMYTGWTWDQRERHYKKILAKAFRIVVGTNTGKREIQKYYGIEKNNIVVIPFPMADDHLRFYHAKKNQDAFDNYVLYPAQFWPHKNHIRLLKAIKILTGKYNRKISLVLTGSDKGNKKYIESKIKDLGLEEDVKMKGFVTQYELEQLYQNAFALVFPSFFGPDNYPPLEAMAFGCPVITSNIPGTRDQLGDAALYFDPLDEYEIAEKIEYLFNNKTLRKSMIEKGYLQVQGLSSKNYVDKLMQVVDEFDSFRVCWGD
jgi:glycosyltransferase involved in cell wall biosynthesis